MTRNATYLMIAVWVICLGYDLYAVYRNLSTHAYGSASIAIGLSVLAGYLLIKNIRSLKEMQ